MMHLDQRSYARLLDGSLDPERRRDLAHHLEAPCAECERVVGGGPVDGLDGLVDCALVAVAARAPGEAGNDLEYERIARAVRAARAPRRLCAPIAALAAALVAVGGAAVAVHLARPPQVAWDGQKGAAPATRWARLRFAVVRGADGVRPSIGKGSPGERVSSGDRLQFQVELARPADVALVRLAPGDAPELLFRDRLAAGATTLSVAGQPAAVGLEGLAGPQRFVIVAAPRALAPDRIAALAPALSSPGGGDRAAPEGVAVDAVEVEVR